MPLPILTVSVIVRAHEPLIIKPAKQIILCRLSEAMTPYAVWYTVKKYADMTEVENVSPHSFRHTVATRLVRDPEVDLVTAATYLGHSCLDTTARYSKPSEEDLEKAAEKLSSERQGNGCATITDHPGRSRTRLHS